MQIRFVRYGISLLFSVTLLAAEPPKTILLNSGTRPPIFISASAMFAADGTIAEVVPKDWRPQQQRYAEIFSRRPDEVSAFAGTSAPCHGVMMVETPLESLVNRTTRNDAILNARAIVAGTIQSVTPGFFFGTPGSLVELGNLDKIKAEAPYGRVQESLFIRLPYARFVSGGTEYCRESGPAAYAPKIGDRVLVFAYDHPMDSNGTLIYSTSSDVIVQPTGGAIRIPKSFSFFETSKATIEGVVVSIRSVLSGRENPVAPAPHDRRAQ
jgi:hypothetical protein